MPSEAQFRMGEERGREDDPSLAALTKENRHPTPPVGIRLLTTQNLSLCVSNHSGLILWRKSRVEFPNHLCYDEHGMVVNISPNVAKHQLE